MIEKLKDLIRRGQDAHFLIAILIAIAIAIFIAIASASGITIAIASAIASGFIIAIFFFQEAKLRKSVSEGSVEQLSVRPHRLADKLLYLLLSKKHREHIPGDLEEEFKEVILPKFGRSYAQFWYWSQVLRSVIASNKWAARFIAYGGGVAGLYQVAKGVFQDSGWIEGDESEIKEKEVKKNR